MSDDFPIRIDQRGTVAVWTIDRADRMNALSRATLVALGQLAREAASNASVRAIVLCGAGDKASVSYTHLAERGFRVIRVPNHVKLASPWSIAFTRGAAARPPGRSSAPLPAALSHSRPAHDTSNATARSRSATSYST